MNFPGVRADEDYSGIMKTFSWSGILSRHAYVRRPLLVLLWMLTCALSMAGGEKPEPLDPRLAEFVKAKEQQARDLAESLSIKVSPGIWKGFDLFRQGDWAQASNHFAKLMERNSQYQGSTVEEGVGTPVWQPLMEVSLILTEFYAGEPKYARAFGEDIIASIPPGSIYFGGTDPGRGLVTGLMRSHVRADPFFVLTQNALADANYLEYLRHIYGKQIYIPSGSDSAKAFQDYLAEAQKRLQQNQLKPGEDVRISDNRVQVSGQVAVMSINGLLTKMMFEQNPEHGFYLEESFPLDWMYPHLVPHNLILKIERQPLAGLSDEMVQRDHQYWADYCRRLIGDWLHADTPVRDIATFADRVYRLKDFSGFKGDPSFVQSDRARKSFSKLRSSQGGVYQWRLQNAKTPAERDAMSRAADLALGQAFALCPYSPEAVFRYVSLLFQLQRHEDALIVAQTCQKLDPSNRSVEELVEQIKSFRKQPAEAAKPSPTTR